MMSNEEIRAVAIQAAATLYSNREPTHSREWIMRAAQDFAEYIKGGPLVDTVSVTK